MNNESQSNRTQGNRCGDTLRTLLLIQALQGRKGGGDRDNFLPLFLALQGNQGNQNNLLLLFLLMDRKPRRPRKSGYKSDYEDFPNFRQSGGSGKRESKASKSASQQEPSHTA
ncbi:hypothetical protein [Neolewinella litorea]|uniref:Uncharacterized protein n=1 Tax=Neolewinella litorea TaxID=2562452 RepID=A0A4S4NNT3_9BACT|nr:hypothetical protein [Neolewinella litorea]THH40041.1 hypothetical protein E4021_10590 [Neolewinella litorea]